MVEFIDEQNAVMLMKEIGVQQEGIELMKDKAVHKLILLKDVRNAVCNIIKQDMLSIGGEVAVNKGCINCTIKRSDAVIMGTIHQIKLLVTKLKTQVSEIPDIAVEIENLINDA